MSNYDKIKFLCTHHAELLKPRGVHYLKLLRGHSAAGRVLRLAQAAVAEQTDFHVGCEPEEWKADSEALYVELLCLAERIGSLTKARCAYYLEQLKAEPTAAGRFRMLYQLQHVNARHTPELVKAKVENLHVLNGKEAYGQRPEPTELERLTA